MQWKADEEAEYLGPASYQIYLDGQAQDQAKKAKAGPTASIDDALNAALQAWGGVDGVVELEEDGECV
jgi:hypothetical protein